MENQKDIKGKNTDWEHLYSSHNCQTEYCFSVFGV